MPRDIRLLDCTLRDGGYVNKWRFGNGSITCIFDRLNEAGVDIIEVGFLDDREPFDMDRSIQPDSKSLDTIFSNAIQKRSMIVAMIDYGTCSIDNILPCEETMLDGIRVIFKKEKMKGAIDFGGQLVSKGYKVFLQLVSITDYDESDIKALAEYAGRIHPFAVSIVDTYGLMHEEQVHDYFKWLDKYLDPKIGIGYHSHNNFQLAYSNTLEMLHMDTDRDLVLDGTLYGMGKSAGNAPLELLAMYLNDNRGKDYDISQILEAINSEIMPIYTEHYWGYSLFFYIAAKNGCHPNYVKYLMDKKTLSIKDVNSILERIESDVRLRYNENYIETLHGEYLLENIDDSECIRTLGELMRDKDILILGPGKSIIDKKDEIRRFISEKKPVVISVNFIPDDIDIDYLFISNPNRYKLVIPKLMGMNIKVIGTSNVTPAGRPFDYSVRYDLLIRSDTIWDNSLAILLNLFTKIGIKKLNLAGFDGFKEMSDDNYLDKDFELKRSREFFKEVNACMTKMIRDKRKIMDIEFVTDSIYEGNKDN